MKSKNSFLLFISIALIMQAFSLSAYSQSVDGDWYGKADVDGITLRLVVHVKSADQGYSSTWDSPDQGAFGLVSSTTTFKYPDFSFTSAEAGFKYTGQINDAYTEITGNLEQGGRKFEIKFGRKPISPPSNSPEASKE